MAHNNDEPSPELKSKLEDMRRRYDSDEPTPKAERIGLSRCSDCGMPHYNECAPANLEAMLRTIYKDITANLQHIDILKARESHIQHKLWLLTTQTQPSISRAAQELRRKTREKRNRLIGKLAGRELDVSKLTPEQRNKLASAKRALENTLEDLLYGDD